MNIPYAASPQLMTTTEPGITVVNCGSLWVTASNFTSFFVVDVKQTLFSKWVGFFLPENRSKCQKPAKNTKNYDYMLRDAANLYKCEPLARQPKYDLVTKRWVQLLENRL